ncbi:hypothetical protein KCP70_07365 [Salmonella enterica subsp. enterica]|nr:hypothetical protein KCP70_07365 [Salmonella enterica subsp. enterica]
MADSVLANFPRVKYLLCGHIHRAGCDWNGRRLLASPSTCVQFKPHCRANFTLNTIAPELAYAGAPGGTASRNRKLHRLQDTRFRPLRKDTDVYASTLFARINGSSLGKACQLKLAGRASSMLR